MSGGELDYVYLKVLDACGTIEQRARTPLHVALVKHLRKVADALHNLEWVWSGDMSPGDEDETIRALVGVHGELSAALDMALIARHSLDSAIQKAQEVQGEHE